MRTTPVQTPTSAVDIAGISALTSARSATNPTLGTLWDLSGLAAAQPVHFHPLTPSMFVMVFRRRWYAPTLSSTDPGGFTAHSEDTAPCWALVSAPSGGASTIGSGYALPTNTPGTRYLVAAASRATNYLYTLSTDGWTDAVLTMIATPVAGAFTIIGEETLPHPAGVLFSAGVWVESPHLVVAGTDSLNQVYLVRKPWHAVGSNTPTGVHATSITSDPSWSYYTGSGWSSDASRLAPVQTASGTLTSAGPLSWATYNTRSFLSTVAADATTRSAVLWSRTGPTTAWTQLGAQPLGSTDDGSYLGGTMQLQQALPAAVQTLWGNAAAICWVTSTKSVLGGITKLINTWDRWLIDAPSRPAPATGTANLSLTLGLGTSGIAGYFRSLATSGRGRLTAAVHSSKFTLAPAMGTAGRLTATTRIYQLRTYPAVRGPGRLTATARATKFTFTAPLRGRGTLSSVLGLIRSAPLRGTGRLTAPARLYALTVFGTTSGRGSLTTAPIKVLLGASPMPGKGALTVAARMYSIRAGASMSGHGALTVTTIPRYTRGAAFASIGSLFNALLLQPRPRGVGRLTATVVATGFRLPAQLAGRGRLTAPYHQLAFLYGAALKGRGLLSAAAIRIERGADIRGRGTLSTVGYQKTAFDAASNGTAIHATSISWTHPLGPGANLLLVAVGTWYSSGGYSNWARTVTYAGLTMTSVGVYNNGNTSGFGWSEVFALWAPPAAGTPTVVVTETYSTNIPYLSGCSASYRNAVGLGAPVYNSGTSGSGIATGSIATTTDSMAFGVLVTGSNRSVSAPTGSQRAIQPAVATTNFVQAEIQDAVGAGSPVTLSATLNSSCDWSSIGLQILGPIPAATPAGLTSGRGVLSLTTTARYGARWSGSGALSAQAHMSQARLPVAIGGAGKITASMRVSRFMLRPGMLGAGRLSAVVGVRAKMSSSGRGVLSATVTVTTYYAVRGAYTYNIPATATAVSVIVLGGGGQGSCGQFGGGTNGGNSTATVGSTTLTGAGGNGGTNGAYSFGYNADDNGKSPGNKIFAGVTYVGGAEAGPQGNGISPGGGGGGGVWSGFYAQGGYAGSWATPQTFAVNGATGITTIPLTVGAGGPYGGQQTPGAPGADGAVWIVARFS